MSTFMTTAKDAGDKFLERLGAYQEIWLKNVSAFSKYRSPVMSMAMPGYSGYAKLAKANFDFLEKLLAQQQKFAASMYKTSTPVAKSPPEKKASARPAAKRKTTKRKATTKRKTSRSTTAAKTPPAARDTS